MNKKTLKKLALGTAMLVAASSFTACKKGGSTATDVDINNGSEVVLNGDAIYPVK